MTGILTVFAGEPNRSCAKLCETVRNCASNLSAGWPPRRLAFGDEFGNVVVWHGLQGQLTGVAPFPVTWCGLDDFQHLAAADAVENAPQSFNAHWRAIHAVQDGAQRALKGGFVWVGIHAVYLLNFGVFPETSNGL